MYRNLIEKVPKYYRNSKVMACLLGTSETALNAAEEMLVSVDKQCLIGTADIMLSRWEQIFGIAVSQESYERRRERLLARKRGGGTGTIEHLKNVILSFSNGEIDIAEHYDEYMIVITFSGRYGIPPYIDDVKAAIEEIIPAHIGYTIAILYRIWSDFKDKTWAELSGYTWDEIREGDI